MWQWVHHKQKLDDGRLVDLNLCRAIVAEELDKTKAMVGEQRFNNGRYGEAARLFETLIAQENFTEFLTLPAYDQLVAEGA